MHKGNLSLEMTQINPRTAKPFSLTNQQSILAKLQEFFNRKLKYCLLNNSVMCVDDFSIMFLFLLKVCSKPRFHAGAKLGINFSIFPKVDFDTFFI